MVAGRALTLYPASNGSSSQRQLLKHFRVRRRHCHRGRLIAEVGFGEHNTRNLAVLLEDDSPVDQFIFVRDA